MQTLELERMGLTPLTTSEMNEIEGGNWFTWIAEKVIAYTYDYAASGGYARDLSNMGTSACNAAMNFN